MQMNQPFFAARRARRRARDQTPVSALCTCVLGERSAAASDWPPRSVAELTQHVDFRPGSLTFGLAACELLSLLEEGLAALDQAALDEGGQIFALLDRATQLPALFRLECGRSNLSRRRACAFVDAFLALAAQVYLHDAREVTRATSRAGAWCNKLGASQGI